MLIGGLQKMTLIDYPGKVSATVFTVGCNFRCRFCHNPELVLPDSQKKHKNFSEKEILDFFKSRQKLLDAVCITGGEPTLHKDLPEFIKKIKELGLSVKLDSNGTNPSMLKKLIDQKLVDYVAMDIKAPWKKYETVVDRKIDLEKIKKSVKILKEGQALYEFRSTVIPAFHSPKDIIEMARQIKGAPAYYIQKFQSAPKLVDEKLVIEKKYTSKELDEIKSKIKHWFKKCSIR